VTSAIPAAIDALVVMARQVLPVDELGERVQVMDGPVSDWPEQEYVAIGLSPNDFDNPGTRAAAGLETSLDDAEVIGMIRAWSGDDDIAPLRARAYELFDALVAGTEADNRLGGAVDLAELTSCIYAPGASNRGRWVDLVIAWTVRKF
jgi:hypothetical protein